VYFYQNLAYICVTKAKKMKISTTLQSTRIKITEPSISDIYFIEQDETNNRFYVTSDNGYNGFEGEGFSSLVSAIHNVNKMIKNYFNDRCEENPKGW